MQAPHLATRLIFALVCCVAWTGCNERDDALSTPGEEISVQDRYVQRVMPRKQEWQRESELPNVPQAYPKMAMWEVSTFPPDAVPTPAQRRAADELRHRCFASAEAHGWFDFERGVADGYHVSVDSEGKPHEDRHFRNDEFLLDDRILDCDRPEYLMYYPNPDGSQKLVGFMFLARSIDEHGPQVGGPLTLWHYHIWSSEQCFERGVIVVDTPKNDRCSDGTKSYRSPEMLHVWFVDRPGGPFSTSMHLEEHFDLTGLDAPFVVSPGADSERFMAELDAVIAGLDEKVRPVVSQSVSYLIFAFGKGFTADGQLRVDRDDVADPERRGREALLRVVEQRGPSVRVRLFVGLAAELDAVRPGIWKEYEAVHGEQEMIEATESHHH